MVGTPGLHDTVGGHGLQVILGVFLQAAFIIGIRPRAPGILEMEGQLRGDDVKGGLVAAIEINRRQHRFEGVGENGGLFATAGLGLPPAQFDKTPQFDRAGHFRQPHLADQLGAGARKVAFVHPGVLLHQHMAHHQVQDGIAQKLQGFVVAQIALRAFVYKRAVLKGLLQVVRVPKPVIEGYLEGVKLVGHTQASV